MPREAKLFSSSAGSVVRGYLKFRANIRRVGYVTPALRVSVLNRSSCATFAR